MRTRIKIGLVVLINFLLPLHVLIYFFAVNMYLDYALNQRYFMHLQNRRLLQVSDFSQDKIYDSRDYRFHFRAKSHCEANFLRLYTDNYRRWLTTKQRAHAQHL